MIFSSKKVWYSFTYAVACFILFGFDWHFKGVFGQKALLSLSVMFTIYWTVSIFVFLFKRSFYTSYTTVIQRYWKRTLYLFWLLELFLFSIFLYLILVAPTEVEWLLDQPQLFSSNYFSGSIFFNKIILLTGIIYLITGVQFILFNLNKNLLNLTSLVISLCLIIVLFADFYQTYLYSVYYSAMSWNFDMDDRFWDLTYDFDKCRVITHYMFLVIILKFWHTVFIAAFWFTTTHFNLYATYVGQGAYAANKQNFFFLFGFGYILSFNMWKVYSNVSGEGVYTWFFVNPYLLNTNSTCFDIISSLF